MARKHELSRGEHCISSTMFREYITAARSVDGSGPPPLPCTARLFAVPYTV